MLGPRRGARALRCTPQSRPPSRFLFAAILIGPPEPPLRPATYELTWRAPESCPDDAHVRTRIDALSEAWSGGEGTMLVEGEVTRNATGFHLQLTTAFNGQTHARELHAPRCASLVESTALVVVAALETGRIAPPTVEPEPPSLPPVPTPPTLPPALIEPEIIPVHPRRAEPPPRARPQFDPVVRVAPLLEGGAVPGIGGGLNGAIGLAFPRLRLEIDGTHIWPRRGPRRPDAAGLYQLGVVGVRGCFLLRTRRVDFPLCGALEGGALRVDARGLSAPRTLHAAWLAATPAVGLAARRGRVGVWSLLEAVIPIIGARFNVGEDEVFRSLPVAPRVMLGIEIFFGTESR